jgi:hypothetical protein
MSNYVDFERDFPSRCFKVLDEFRFDAKSSGREVTLLLAMSASMICLVADRIGLGADREKEIRSTPFKKSDVRDRWRRFEDALASPSSSTQPLEVLTNTQFSTGVLMSRTRDPHEWPWRSLPADLTNRQLYSMLRNSFAHGNVWTESGKSREIESLVFASKLDAEDGEEKPYEAVRMTPTTLQRLMQWWIGTVCESDELQQLRVTQKMKARSRP